MGTVALAAGEELDVTPAARSDDPRVVGGKCGVAVAAHERAACTWVRLWVRVSMRVRVRVRVRMRSAI
jgi:hypothetical protein